MSYEVSTKQLLPVDCIACRLTFTICNASDNMSVIENEKVKVLIIDDNRDAADTLACLLQILGFQADFRTDGRSGIQAAQQMVPDVVLLDIGMPIMDGYETAGLLRCAPELQRCKIVALTAWGDFETRKVAEASGFHWLLTKPASVHSLMSVLTLGSQSDGVEP